LSARYILHAAGRELELGERPLLMGVVNASPDSFSDGGRYGDAERQLALARTLVADGADILDVGGESAATGRPPVGEQREIERVVPLIEGIVGLDLTNPPVVSVDTYKPAVARVAIAAGASIVNDVSGLRDPELARVCAQNGAALVVMHTRAAPKQRLQDPDLYGGVGERGRAGEREGRLEGSREGGVVDDVLTFLSERVALALAQGMTREQLLLDPGPDFAKTPAQTIEVLAHAERLHELELPLLWAISRKDFIGALTSSPPRERLGGTLAALAHGVDVGAHIFRVHDVRAAADFLRVRAALRGEEPPRRDLALAEEHRYERLPE
jgi:dihydropteroate synthase